MIATPAKTLGFAINLGGHPMICYHTDCDYNSSGNGVKNERYEFLMVTDVDNLKSTNLFDEQCCIKLDKFG